MKYVFATALLGLSIASHAQSNVHISGPRYDAKSDQVELQRALDCTVSQAAYDQCFWDAITEYQANLPGINFSQISPPLIGVQFLNSQQKYFFEQPPAAWDLEEMRHWIADHDDYSLPGRPTGRSPAIPIRNPNGHNQRYINGLPTDWLMVGENSPIYGQLGSGVQLATTCMTNPGVYTSPWITGADIGNFNQNGSIIQFNYCPRRSW